MEITSDGMTSANFALLMLIMPVRLQKVLPSTQMNNALFLFCTLFGKRLKQTKEKLAKTSILHNLLFKMKGV